MTELTQMRPGLWLVESQLEDFRVRGAVIAGTERLLVWDTLARPADMEGIAELAPTLPLLVVYSHADWDHVLGTSGLTRSPMEIIGHASSLHRFSQELPKDLGERRALHPAEYAEARILPPTRTLEVGPPVHKGLTIDLGGLDIQLYHLPGHTPDSMVCFVAEWGLFLGGDSVETPLPFLNPGSPVRAWSEALTAWAKKLDMAPGPSLVVPSHGDVSGPELLRGNARYLDALLAGEEPELSGPLSPFYQETHANNVILARVP
jgi:glyoxylase-like metal-dependent hydrolase (beta-lactamase superfamily II)